MDGFFNVLLGVRPGARLYYNELTVTGFLN